jgi:hypothetical protein
MTEATLIQAVVADQRDALIRAEVLTGALRERLEQAVVQALRAYNISIEEASEASGLRVEEIRALLDRAPSGSSDLADLAGLR